MYYVYLHICIFVYISIYLHICKYVYMYLYLYKEKKLLKVKSQVEVLAFGGYMFESLQSFNNSQAKHTPCH